MDSAVAEAHTTAMTRHRVDAALLVAGTIALAAVLSATSFAASWLGALR